MNNLLADIQIAPDGLRGFGPLGLEGKSTGQASTVFSQFLSGIVGVMTVIAFIWFLVQFFIGAVSIIGAAGDKAKVEAARTKITTSLVGLVVVIAAIFLIDLVGSLLGIDILNIGGLIERLGVK